MSVEVTSGTTYKITNVKSGTVVDLSGEDNQSSKLSTPPFASILNLTLVAQSLAIPIMVERTSNGLSTGQANHGPSTLPRRTNTSVSQPHLQTEPASLPSMTPSNGISGAMKPTRILSGEYNLPFLFFSLLATALAPRSPSVSVSLRRASLHFFFRSLPR